MNPLAPAQLFTAAQIALALGVTARAVKLRLVQTPAVGIVSVRGQKANAWQLESLPESLRRELTDLAGRRGLASAAQLLSAPAAPWQPPVPWHQIAQPFRDRAQRLSDALAPALGRQHEISGPDLMDLARTLYRQEFGHVLADEKLRYLLDRATKRDNNLRQWQRPDLFLDDAAFHSVSAGPLQLTGLHELLAPYVRAVKNKAQPSPHDRALLFHNAFLHRKKYFSSRRTSGELRAFTNSLVEYLYHNVPGLYQPRSASPGREAGKPLLAVRRFFNQTLQEWTAGGCTVGSIMDKRPGNCGRKGRRCPDCEKIILRTAAQFRGDFGEKGNVDLAIKLLVAKNSLCLPCLQALSARPMSSAFRRRVTPNALQVASLKGPDAVRKIAPTKHCDWSDTSTGDRFVIDDMTTNELAWDTVDGQTITGQVQLLYTEDEFSSFPLPFLMYFGPPNSRTIKKALWTVFSRVGLPHVALLTERGVFKNRTIAGEREARHALDFMELEAGLNQHLKFGPDDTGALDRLRGLELGLRDPAIGLKIQHAFSPQAKTVERSFYELQKRSSVLPGFAGFNQRNEKSRAMQDFDRRVEAGKEHPGSERLHLSDLRKNYEQICVEFMHRPINGVRHRGRSPLDLWNETLQRRPFRKLPPEIEHLFALRHIPGLTVRTQGICLALDRYEDAFYFNEHTGPLVGRKVAVRVNYDIPEFIYLEHPETRKLLKVDRVLTRRRTATSEEMAKSNAARRAHVNGALGEIGNLHSPISSWITRAADYSAADKERGRVIADATAQHLAGQKQVKRLAEHNSRKAAVLGVVTPEKPKNSRRQSEALALLAESEAESAAQENPKRGDEGP